MDRKPPRRPDGFNSSRPEGRGPRRDGDARPPRREGGEHFRDRDDRRGGERFEGRSGDRFDNRGPRNDRGGRPGGDGDRGGFGDRPRRPARAEWANNGDQSQGDRPRFDRGGERGDRPRFDRGGERGDRPRFDRGGEGGDRPRFDRGGERGDRPRFDRGGERGDRPRFDRGGEGGDRPRFDRGGEGGDRPRFDRGGERGDRPRFDRGGEGGDRPRFDRGGERGDRPRFDRGGERGDRPRFDRGGEGGGERFADRRPRFDRAERDDNFGNREDYSPRRGGDRSERPGRDGRPDFKEARPRKDRYQVWNKELPQKDEAPRQERSTLKIGNRPEAVERKIYGVNACLSFFSQRPGDIIRGYFTEAVARQHFGEMMKYLAAEKKAYHLVPADDMERITESTHHEGVCLLVRDQPAESFFHWLETTQTDKEAPSCILVLEDIGNPHNVGAIMRVAAHFGAKALVVKDAGLARSGAAMRTAEGGAEHVKLLEADDFARMLTACRREGYTVVSTSSHEGNNLFEQPLPARAVILLGQESKGLSSVAVENSDLKVMIPGTRQVESLNVSVAAGILLAEYWRNFAGKAE